MITKYLETGSTNPYYNLAFEEFVLQNRKDANYLILWQNKNTIVIGCNQNAEAEINRTFVDAHNTCVVRRTTGGGAVYHDLGNLNYSFISDIKDAELFTLSDFTRPVIEALVKLGLQAEASGRNDILVNGHKVSGTAQRILGQRILHHGTLLFDSDSAMVEGALRVNPEKFRSKSAKSVRSRIGNIRTFLETDMSLNDFWGYLRMVLVSEDMIQDHLTDAELRAVEELRCSKYDTWDWNFGKSPKFDFTNLCWFEGGGLEVGISVAGGHITQIAFYGDFLAVLPIDSLINALIGCPFEQEAVSDILDQFPLQKLFGGIKRDQILNVMFHVGDL